MSRGLTAGQLSVLSANEFRVEELLEIYLPTGEAFYTTGDMSVTVTTPTGGSHGYSPNGFISQIGNIQESFEAGPNSLDIQFSKFENIGFISVLDDNDIINSRVVLYKLFRNVNDFTPDSTDGLLQIFDGSISGLDIDSNLENKTYTIRCTSDFGDYDKQRGRTTADISGALVGTTIFWGSFYLE